MLETDCSELEINDISRSNQINVVSDFNQTVDSFKYGLTSVYANSVSIVSYLIS